MLLFMYMVAQLITLILECRMSKLIHYFQYYNLIHAVHWRTTLKMTFKVALLKVAANNIFINLRAIDLA